MIVKDQRGFTTVEAACVIIIFAVLMAGGLDLYVRGIILWNRGEKKADVQDNLRIGLDRMARELRQAKRLTVNTTSNNASNDILEFINHEGTIIRYEVSGSSLRRRAGYGNYEPLSSYISEVGGLRVEWSAPAGGNQAAATLVKVKLCGFNGLTGAYSLSTSVRLRKLN